ncbi:hypothetical protein HZ326_6241 [Fusarium oxysporum f. sp. albedinis]|nr:hypothetical protein HZ326_6241 [Fusarium oxysporum f. sp. albedinis]
MGKRTLLLPYQQPTVGTGCQMPHSQDSSLFVRRIPLRVSRLVIVGVDRPPQFHVVFSTGQKKRDSSQPHTLTLDTDFRHLCAED